ncbi:cation:proton antiporter, partial [Streptococcus anginosus]|nr:cation:proton antiporter [Streptococcus anginosus]
MTNEDALEPLTLAGEFLLALAVALVVGWAVGEVAVRVRSRISDSAADTAVSFTVPFLASVPAEHLGGSGLVAAVVA